MYLWLMGLGWKQKPRHDWPDVASMARVGVPAAGLADLVAKVVTLGHESLGLPSRGHLRGNGTVVGLEGLQSLIVRCACRGVEKTVVRIDTEKR